MKNLVDVINEAREERYDVQFVGYNQTVTILVPARSAVTFEDFAKEKEGDIFAHVQGENIQF